MKNLLLTDEEIRLEELEDLAIEKYYSQNLNYEGVDLDAFVDTFVEKHL